MKARFSKIMAKFEQDKASGVARTNDQETAYFQSAQKIENYDNTPAINQEQQEVELQDDNDVLDKEN